ncbi:hypothetical protein QBC34DRAFT_430792 [Podospora aff. communis PSN243]|uniref:Uncharacterized protein n=1 Tax=Podospora aff. communis PSN243 TaxID=3040156 RepID=A0AAV9G4I5_9PEZI|nr:hypothetical protein QBC34DRAFT_430792 [Podospora aff. communis PSN243]
MADPQPLRTIEAASELSLMEFNYRLGHRYSTRTNPTSKRILDGEVIPIGINPLNLSPIFLALEPLTRLATATQLLERCQSNKLCERPLGPTIIDVDGQAAAGAILHCEVFMEGRLRGLKMALYNAKQGTSTAAEMADRNVWYCSFIGHFPMGLPESTIYSVGGLDSRQRPINFRTINFGNGGMKLFTKLPVFDIRGSVPAEALSIVRAFIAAHPRDLMFEEVLVQKALQWIWIMEAPDKHLEPFAFGQWRLKFDLSGVELSAWFLLAHSYEIFHQDHCLSYYMHPIRFISAMVKDRVAGSLALKSQHHIWQQLLQRLVAILRPLAERPLGFVISGSMRGTSLPDLTDRMYLPPNTGDWQDRACLCDWRALGHPRPSVWMEVMVNHRGNPPADLSLLRPLWFPSSWLHPAVLKSVVASSALIDDKVWNMRPKDPADIDRIGSILDVRHHAGEGPQSLTRILGPRHLDSTLLIAERPRGELEAAPVDLDNGVASAPSAAGTGKRKMAAMLQMPPDYNLAPSTREYLHRYQAEVLERAKMLGCSIDQLQISPVTGLLEIQLDVSE